MKRSGLILIVVGLILALVSVFGVLSISKNQTAVVPTPTPVPIVKVVVATQNIAERTMLQSSMLTLKDWPADLLPTGTISKIQDVIGKVTSTPLAAGEIVLINKVSTEQTAVGLAPTLPPGLVAMSLGVSSMSAVGGAIRQGDSVDILVSMEYSIYTEQGDESKPMQSTFYTIQDVPVLAISGQVDSTAAPQAGATKAPVQSNISGINTLTVLVTPQDALLLKYSKEKGTIDLVLRSPQYHDQVVTDPVYLEYIMRRFELPRPLLIRKDAQDAGVAQ